MDINLKIVRLEEGGGGWGFGRWESWTQIATNIHSFEYAMGCFLSMNAEGAHNILN